MKRRTLLKSVAALAAIPVLSPGDLLAQAVPPIAPKDIPTLTAIAEVVLPQAIGAEGRDKAVARFVSWIRNYKEGADRGHGYGASTLQQAAPPLRLSGYPAQLAALEGAAVAAGARSLATLALDKRRAIIEAALNTPQPVTQMPAHPAGANVVADFMGMFFNSADATDLAYNAAIGRDTCRGLDGSDKPPAPLKGA